MLNQKSGKVRGVLKSDGTCLLSIVPSSAAPAPSSVLRVCCGPPGHSQSAAHTRTRPGPAPQQSPPHVWWAGLRGRHANMAWSKAWMHGKVAACCLRPTSGALHCTHGLHAQALAAAHMQPRPSGFAAGCWARPRCAPTSSAARKNSKADLSCQPSQRDAPHPRRVCRRSRPPQNRTSAYQHPQALHLVPDLQRRQVPIRHQLLCLGQQLLRPAHQLLSGSLLRGYQTSIACFGRLATSWPVI